MKSQAPASAPVRHAMATLGAALGIILVAGCSSTPDLSAPDEPVPSGLAIADTTSTPSSGPGQPGASC